MRRINVHQNGAHHHGTTPGFRDEWSPAARNRQLPVKLAMLDCRIMGGFRQFPGYVLAVVLCGVGIIQMVVAWSGWSLGLNWQWGLVAIVLSLVARFNGYILVGTFFFAQEYLHWPLPQCLALTIVGLFFLTPGIFRDIMSALTGRDIRPL